MSQPSPNKRCSTCILPSCLPGSDFDSEGRCRWCRMGFPNYSPHGEDELRRILDRSRRPGSGVDCVVGISGGKDSSYVLLELSRRYGLRVEAFTYVHDGLTNFALENAREMCRSLQIRHHEIGLPGHRHLKSFKAFFAAWLESGKPLTAAMTCVACKHLHILGTRLAAELGAPFAVWAASPFEVPPFIPTQPADAGVNARSHGVVALASVLAKTLVVDQGFRRAFCSDIPTCVFGCLAFRPTGPYLRWRHPAVRQIEYFEFCEWDRDKVTSTLKRETRWQVPLSIVSDWHSDCLFNVFKEYMFQSMLGASYTDAFLANQVRFGLLTREEAWEELKCSKRFYAEEVFRVLPRLGLEHLTQKCDVSCFDISNQSI